MSVPGEALVTYGYNDADQLTGVTRASSTVMLGYDQAARRQTITFPSSPQFVQTYGYDNANEISSITYQRGADPSDNLAYAYDLSGKRTAVHGSSARTGLPSATTATAAYDLANRLSSWNGEPVTSDDNGNLTGQDGLTYSYNARNQLASVSDSQSTLESFAYDGLGRRAEKVLSGSTTKFVYDGWNVVQEKDAQNQVTANVLSGLGLDEWLSRAPSSGSATYYLTDALGSTVGLTDSTGSVATSYTFDPYGNTATSGAASTNSFQFTGRENDSISLLSIYHLRAREYAPAVGRFLTEDPIGVAGGDPNLHIYVGSRPVDAVDPLGLWCLIHNSSGGCLGGGVVRDTGDFFWDHRWQVGTFLVGAGCLVVSGGSCAVLITAYAGIQTADLAAQYDFELSPRLVADAVCNGLKIYVVAPVWTAVLSPLSLFSNPGCLGPPADPAMQQWGRK